MRLPGDDPGRDLGRRRDHAGGRGVRNRVSITTRTGERCSDPEGAP